MPGDGGERVVGRYLYSGMAMNARLDGDITAQLGGQMALTLAAESADRFHPDMVDATLVFSPASGLPDTLTHAPWRTDLEFKRDGA